MDIRENNLKPGNCVSVDQYLSSITGRLLHTKGKEPTKDKYNGGSLFYDHSSKAMFIVSQVSLRAGETTMAKRKFE